MEAIAAWCSSRQLYRSKGTFCRPCISSLSKKPIFLESASIRLRGVAGLDGGTSHATCSLAACRRCCRCARAAQRYLTNDEAADYLRLSPRTLEKQRVIGGGPKFRKFGRRVMYAVSDLDAGPMRAATRRLPTRNMPSGTRATTVTAADLWLAGGHRHVSPSLPCGSDQRTARTARPVPRSAGRDMAPRDAQDLMAYPFSRWRSRGAPRRSTSQRQHHHPRGRHAGAWYCHHLGCRHPDLGCQPDRRSQDAGIQPSRRMQATPYEILRFIGRGSRCATISVSRLRSTGCNRPRWPRPSAKRREGACTAFVDQRMEGTGRCQRHAAGHRADPAGLVLCGRAGRCSSADHRPDVFPPHGRHRALAVPPSAQAWRQAGTRLAVRLPASAPQVGQQYAIFGFCHHDLRALVARQSLPGYELGIVRTPGTTWNC